MSTKKATEDQLAALHSHLATVLKEAIDGEPVIVEGEVVGKKFNAAAFREARQFLLDNNITSTIDSKPMRDLVDSLPSFEDASAFHPVTHSH